MVRVQALEEHAFLRRLPFGIIAWHLRPLRHGKNDTVVVVRIAPHRAKKRLRSAPNQAY